jgi:septal ring factor EnvC (AmiA/AmiB activator)
MARPNTGLNFNIAQLERILNDRRSEVSRLERQRAELQRKLDGLDRHIVKLNGGLRGMRGRLGAAGGGGRARNARSLVETLEEVMRANGKPMRVGDIVDAVTATGYRSNSANFRGIINQTLIKDKRFGQVERGVYELKSGGSKKKAAAE